MNKTADKSEWDTAWEMIGSWDEHTYYRGTHTGTVYYCRYVERESGCSCGAYVDRDTWCIYSAPTMSEAVCEMNAWITESEEEEQHG